MPGHRWLLLAGLLLLASNLRAPIAAVGPILLELRRDLEFGSGAAGLITSLPVLLFAVAAPLAVALGRRFGGDVALLLGIAGICVGGLIRVVPSVSAIVTGTAIIGIAIAVGNVLLPSAIKQYFSDREGLVTSLYMGALTGGAAFAAAFSAPVARFGDSGWQGSFLFWAGFAALAGLVWAPQLRFRRSRFVSPRPPRRRIWSYRTTWGLAFFFGLQSFGFYSLVGWLPTLLIDRGVPVLNAGLALALFSLLGIPASLVVPIIITRFGHDRLVGLVVALTWFGALAGFIVSPQQSLAWAALGGLGQGAGISLALTLLVIRSETPAVARELSGAVQGLGYLVGGAGPIAVAFLYDATAGSTVPLLAIGGAVALGAVFAWWGVAAMVRG